MEVKKIYFFLKREGGRILSVGGELVHMQENARHENKLRGEKRRRERQMEKRDGAGEGGRENNPCLE